MMTVVKVELIVLQETWNEIRYLLDEYHGIIYEESSPIRLKFPEEEE